MFPGQNVLDLFSSRRKTRSDKAWGCLHLVPRSNQIDLNFRVTIRTILVTFGVSAQFCSEAEWSNSDIDRNPQMDVFL